MAAISPLDSIDQLTALLAASAKRPFLVFKHSTRCPISARAWEEFESVAADGSQTRAADFFVVDILRHREVSNELADRLGVVHESPQAILVQDGGPLWHASHHGISRSALAAALRANG